MEGSKINCRRNRLRLTAPLNPFFPFFSQGLDITASTPRLKASGSIKSR